MENNFNASFQIPDQNKFINLDQEEKQIDKLFQSEFKYKTKIKKLSQSNNQPPLSDTKRYFQYFQNLTVSDIFQKLESNTSFRTVSQNLTLKQYQNYKISVEELFNLKKKNHNLTQKLKIFNLLAQNGFKIEYQVDDLSSNQVILRKQTQIIVKIVSLMKNYQIIEVQITIGIYSKKYLAFISPQNSFRNEFQIIGVGAQGCVRSYSQQKNEQTVVKCISLEDSERFNTFLKQFFIADIMSSLKIGPKIYRNSGFDFIIFKDSVQFEMQRCIRLKFQNHQKDLKQNILLLHFCNLVHLDIKPGNILYSPNYKRNVFIDFGISQFIAQNVGEKSLTLFRGTYEFCGKQMQSIIFSRQLSFIDLYFNDIQMLQNTTRKLKFQENKSQNYIILQLNHKRFGQKIIEIQEQKIQRQQIQMAKFKLELQIKYFFYKQRHQAKVFRNMIKQFMTNKIGQLQMKQQVMQFLTKLSIFSSFLFQDIKMILKQYLLQKDNIFAIKLNLKSFNEWLTVYNEVFQVQNQEFQTQKIQYTNRLKQIFHKISKFISTNESEYSIQNQTNQSYFLKKQDVEYILLNQEQIKKFTLSKMLQVYFLYVRYFQSPYLNQITFQQKNKISGNIKQYLLLQNPSFKEEQMQYYRNQYLPQYPFVLQTGRQLIWMYCYLLTYCFSEQDPYFSLTYLLPIIKQCILLQFKTRKFIIQVIIKYLQIYFVKIQQQNLNKKINQQVNNSNQNISQAKFNYDCLITQITIQIKQLAWLYQSICIYQTNYDNSLSYQNFLINQDYQILNYNKLIKKCFQSQILQRNPQRQDIIIKFFWMLNLQKQLNQIQTVSMEYHYIPFIGVIKQIMEILISQYNSVNHKIKKFYTKIQQQTQLNLHYKAFLYFYDPYKYYSRRDIDNQLTYQPRYYTLQNQQLYNLSKLFLKKQLSTLQNQLIKNQKHKIPFKFIYFVLQQKNTEQLDSSQLIDYSFKCKELTKFIFLQLRLHMDPKSIHLDQFCENMNLFIKCNEIPFLNKMKQVQTVLADDQSTFLHNENSNKKIQNILQKQFSSTFTKLLKQFKLLNNYILQINIIPLYPFFIKLQTFFQQRKLLIKKFKSTQLLKQFIYQLKQLCTKLQPYYTKKPIQIRLIYIHLILNQILNQSITERYHIKKYFLQVYIKHLEYQVESINEKCNKKGRNRYQNDFKEINFNQLFNLSINYKFKQTRVINPAQLVRQLFPFSLQIQHKILNKLWQYQTKFMHEQKFFNRCFSFYFNYSFYSSNYKILVQSIKQYCRQIFNIIKLKELNFLSLELLHKRLHLQYEIDKGEDHLFFKYLIKYKQGIMNINQQEQTLEPINKNSQKNYIPQKITQVNLNNRLQETQSQMLMFFFYIRVLQFIKTYQYKRKYLLKCCKLNQIVSKQLNFINKINTIHKQLLLMNSLQFLNHKKYPGKSNRKKDILVRQFVKNLHNQSIYIRKNIIKYIQDYKNITSLNFVNSSSYSQPIRCKSHKILAQKRQKYLSNILQNKRYPKYKNFIQQVNQYQMTYFRMRNKFKSTLKIIEAQRQFKKQFNLRNLQLFKQNFILLEKQLSLDMNEYINLIEESKIRQYQEQNKYYNNAYAQIAKKEECLLDLYQKSKQFFTCQDTTIKQHQCPSILHEIILNLKKSQLYKISQVIVDLFQKYMDLKLLLIKQMY